MNRKRIATLALVLALALLDAGCNGKSDPQAEAPPPLKVQRVEDRNLFQVDRPERFQLTQAVAHVAYLTVASYRHSHSRYFQKCSSDFDRDRPGCGDFCAPWRHR